MAAHITRRFYLLLRGGMFPQHVKQCCLAKRVINNSLQTSVGYGTRGADSTQEDQVQIPIERLRVSYSRSSGAGGQHVNKVSTKAEIRFHVLTAEWIPEDVRRKVFEKVMLREAIDQNYCIQHSLTKQDTIFTSFRSRSLEGGQAFPLYSIMNKNRINKAGELLVTSELSRSQHRNLADCIQKISSIIAEASEKPHEPSAEDIALRAARLEKRNIERLRQKKIHSAIKQSKRLDDD